MTLGTRLGSTFHSFGTAITLPYTEARTQGFVKQLNLDGATKLLISHGGDYSTLASQRIEGRGDTPS